MAEAHGALFRLVATANANGLLSPEQIAEFKVIGKAGGERKLGRTTQAEAILSLYRARSEEIASLLSQHGITVRAEAERRTAEGHRRRGTDTKRLGELSDRQLDERAKRLRIAVAMANGQTAAQALTRVGMPVTAASKRWAQRVSKAYSATGTVDDGRAGRSGAPITALTGEMPALIEALWLRHRNATATGIRLAIEAHVNRVQQLALDGEDVASELLGPEIVAGRARIPSTDTIQRVVQGFGTAKAKIRAQGWREYGKQMRPTVELEWTTHANQEWQIDHTPLDVWARVLQDSVWIRVAVYLTAIIDVHSRAIVAAIVSARYPDAFTTALALRMAILPKEMEEWKARGVPERLVMDNGKDFRSQHVDAFCGALGVDLHYCRPHSPDEKPHIERVFGTLTRELLPLLPGFKHGTDRGTAWSETRIDKLLTPPQIRAEVLRWINEEYHQRAHTETGSAPMELWTSSAANVKVPDARDLDILLLYEEQRRVTRGVIRMTPVGEERGVYWGPCLTTRNGETLLIRYNPDDLLSVYAYDTNQGSFIGELWNLHHPESRYSREDVLAAWRELRAVEKRRLKSLDERVAQYHAQVAADDRVVRARRRRAMQEAEADALALAATQEPAVDSLPVAIGVTPDEVSAMKSALASPPSIAPLPPATPSATSSADADNELAALRKALSA